MKSIFIGGCERSGTTFLGSLLGGHPQCLATPESPFKIAPLITEKSRRDGSRGTEVIDDVLHDIQLRLWGLSWEPSELEELYKANSVEAITQIIVRKYAEKEGKKEFSIWVDHTPSNILYVHRLGIYFPDSKFVHIVRDGRAVAASLMQVRFGPVSVRSAATHWMGRIAAGLAAEATLREDRVVRVHYEDLVQNTELTLRNLCKALGLDFHESMISGGGFEPTRFGRKVNRLVGKRAVRRRLGAWENTLSSREVEIFEALTGDLLSCLRYEPRYSMSARRPTWSETMRMETVGITRRFVNKLVYGTTRHVYASRQK